MLITVWNGTSERDAVRRQQRSPPTHLARASNIRRRISSAERILAILRDYDRPEGYTSHELANLVLVSVQAINKGLASSSLVRPSGVRTRGAGGSGRISVAYRMTS